MIKARSFGIKVSYTACFIKAKPAGRYAALTNQAVHDGPESGDGEGTAKAALTSGRAQAQGLMTAGAMNHWIACQAPGAQFLDLFAPICERSQKMKARILLHPRYLMRYLRYFIVSLASSNFVSNLSVTFSTN